MREQTGDRTRDDRPDRLAETAAGQTPVHAGVTDGAADRLPAADTSCDAAVVSLVLCTVAAPAAALAEIHRVLRWDLPTTAS